MTTTPTGQTQGIVIKGLAKLGNRACHGMDTKYVDMRLFMQRAATPQ